MCFFKSFLGSSIIILYCIALIFVLVKKWVCAEPQILMPINISFIYKLIIIFILKSRKIKCPRIGFCLRKLQNIRPTKIDDYTVHVYGGFKALTKYGSFEYIFINEFFSCKMYMSRSIFISDPLEML